MRDKDVVSLSRAGIYCGTIVLLAMLLASVKCNSDTQAADAAKYAGWHYDREGRWVGPGSKEPNK